jgi:hypothetical protein
MQVIELPEVEGGFRSGQIRRGRMIINELARSQKVASIIAKYAKMNGGRLSGYVLMDDNSATIFVSFKDASHSGFARFALSVSQLRLDHTILPDKKFISVFIPAQP